MIGSVKSTILPLALWTDKPPVHNITSILNLDKSNAIVTGSESGHIFIWSTKTSDNHLVPLNYIIGHRSKIVTLILAGSRKHTDIDYFVSFSKDGELGLWEAGNGRSIEFVSNASFDVQTIVSFESENIKQRLLFCCLKSSEIVIINSMSLSELCTLKCTHNLNMFSSVTSFNISTKDDMVLATSVSGFTSMWILNFADINNKPTFNPKFYDEKALEIDMSNPIKITHNPNRTKIVLIISKCKFMIYHAKDWSVLCHQNCRKGDYFINGEFISSNCFLMHCQSGKSFYYKLPPKSDVEDPLFGQTCVNLSDNIPHLICQFKEPKESMLYHSKVTTKIFENGFRIWKGLSNGSIYKWEFKVNVTDIESQYFSPTSSWSAMKKRPTSLTNMFVDPAISGPVTSLLYIADLCLFVLGMHDGSIFITNFENSLGSVFRKASQTQAKSIKLIGHCGAVLCLNHPCSTMKLHNRLISCSNPRVKSCLQLFKLAHILWSGGDDFTVRIWNMKSQQCINVFHCHSAPVTLLRLNHVSQNVMNIYGFCQGCNAPTSPSVRDDDDANAEDIRQMINTCMNAFMVVISQDNGISIISLMKPKILLYSIEHDSPVKNIGWMLDSKFVLLETINNTVYVWDLSSRSMDRYETDEIAQTIMENCSITKVKSQDIRKVMNVSDMIARHSLSNITSYNSCQSMHLSNKFLKFQFIKTGSSDRYVPVIIFDLTTLLNCLDSLSQIATKFYSLLSEVDNSIIQGFRDSNKISDFDALMMDVTAVNRDKDLKILIIKILFSRAHYQHSACQIDSRLFKVLDLRSDTVACSLGFVNSKTGCITFNLKDLFKEESNEYKLSIVNILLQLSISKKMTDNSSNDRIDSSKTIRTNLDSIDDNLRSRSHSISTSSNSFTVYSSSTSLSKLLWAYQTSILDTHIPLLLNKTWKKSRFSDCPQNLNFYAMEKIFHSLILGILDVCDLISSCAHEILVKVINYLSFHEIQNYLLIIRTILLPDVDHYSTENGRDFSAKIQSYIHRFSEQSFLASDWIWWYSFRGIKIDQDKRKLTKIQIKALVYLAIIGTYLPADDENTNPMDEVKSFSNLFHFDNYFLARVTCDFMMNLLSVDVVAVKRTKNRLVSLAMVCLSNGFTVWEPYINSSTLIYKLFEFTEPCNNCQEREEGGLMLTFIANQALKSIALIRPLVFVMACYREMLRLLNGHSSYSALATSAATPTRNPTLQRMQSSPAFMNSYDSDGVKKKATTLKAEKPKKIKVHNNSVILNRHILFPILDELCKTKKEFVEELLPEIVELYLNCNAKFGHKEIGLQHLLHPFLKFTSVSIDTLTLHVAVGSSNGSLALFNYKTGKYFSAPAHRKSITLTKFSGDAKYLATYSMKDSIIKIWQISHSGLFHMGNTPYHVKEVKSFEVPSVDSMISAIHEMPTSDVTDTKIHDKRPKLKRSSSKNDKATYPILNQSGLGLIWDTDSRNVAIDFDGQVLREFRL